MKNLSFNATEDDIENSFERVALFVIGLGITSNSFLFVLIPVAYSSSN